MENEIQKAQIEKYYNFMVELKSCIDNGAGFSTTDIARAHSVSGAVWNALRTARFISGSKPEGNLKFNIDKVEPIHARILIEKLREYFNDKKSIREKSKEKNNTNKKYLDFLKSIYFLTKENIDFKQQDLIKKHNVSKNIGSACLQTGLVSVKGRKYIFKNEPTLEDADKVRVHLVNQQKAAMKISRANGNVKSEISKEKSKKEKIKKQKTVYYLFGIKIMESITTDII